MSDDKPVWSHPKGSDSKGATEGDTRKISVIDPDDPLGNERATGEHTGQDEDGEEE